MAQDIHRILLKGMGHHDEGVADGVIRPGCAVELTGTSAPTASADHHLFEEQAAAQADALKGGLKIAKEAVLNAGGTIDDAYAAGDIVFFYTAQPGDHLHVLVKAGEDIDIADKLVVEGGGSGLFVKAAAQTKFQLEAIEDSGGVLAADTHIRCRVLNG